MKRLPVLVTFLLAVLAVPVVLAPPAVAKGATDVVVNGPGIEEESLGHTRRMDDVDVGSLAETSGIYGIFGAGQFVARPELTAEELGPGYDLTWYEGSEVLATSRVYPFAEGGAWAEVPEGQRVWDVDLAGGWWHGGTALEQQLRDLGAGPPDAAGVSTSSGVVGPDSRTEGEPVETSGSPLPVAGITGGLVVLAVLGGATTWLLRRRGGTLSAMATSRQPHLAAKDGSTGG